MIFIYCFAVSASNYVHFSDSKHSNEQKHYFELSSHDLSCHFTETENTTTGLQNTVNYPLKFKFFNKDLAVETVETNLSKATFSEYFYSSRDFLIKNRKDNLIFPFHYFW